VDGGKYAQKLDASVRAGRKFWSYRSALWRWGFHMSPHVAASEGRIDNFPVNAVPKMHHL
jgi:hypothetical protein